MVISPHIEKLAVANTTTNMFVSAVSFGAPIAIGDELICTERFDIDKYEDHRPERRTAAELRDPRIIREETLMNLGYSRHEILRVAFEMERIRSRRRRMARPGPLEQVRNVLLRCRRVARPNTL